MMNICMSPCDHSLQLHMYNNVHKELNSDEGYSISTQLCTVAVFFTFSTKQAPVTVCSRVTSEPASILKVTGQAFVRLTQIVREEIHLMHPVMVACMLLLEMTSNDTLCSRGIYL